MSTPIKPLTKRQLLEYFKVYQASFPGWTATVEHAVAPALTRRLGPLQQTIWFEALRSGAYRPAGCVKIAGPPGGPHLLFTFLDIKHRQILPREHESMWRQVIAAMEEQFQPAIRRPLVIAEVLRLAEAEIVRDRIENLNYSSAMATVYAYIGSGDRALWWCEQFTSPARELYDWEINLIEYQRQLRDAIERREVDDFLQRCCD